MSELELTFLAFVMLTVLSLNFRRRLRHLDSMTVRREKMAVAVKEQARGIRSLGRETMHQKRQQQVLVRERDRLIEKNNEATDIIKQMTAVDCRIHVLDDRRSANDLSWITVIKHQGFKAHIMPESTDNVDKQWRVGYRYVVWAPTKERALDKVELTYGAAAGFSVASMELHDEQ